MVFSCGRSGAAPRPHCGNSPRMQCMLRRMVEQTSELRKRWMSWFFGDELAPLERVVRSAQLAKLLRFYVDRAAVHRQSAIRSGTTTSALCGRPCSAWPQANSDSPLARSPASFPLFCEDAANSRARATSGRSSPLPNGSM
jgi:hypothetical protein